MNYPKLAEALGIPLRDLFGFQEGAQTLRELRLLAVMEQSEVAELLFGAVPGASFSAVKVGLSQLERGIEVAHWDHPEVHDSLHRILADAYGVTPEEIEAARRRTQPGHAQGAPDSSEAKQPGEESPFSAAPAKQPSSAALRTGRANFDLLRRRILLSP